jgi:hypothetical protein
MLTDKYDMVGVDLEIPASYARAGKTIIDLTSSKN